MEKSKFLLSPNPLVRYFEKSSKFFTKADIIRYVIDNDIKLINFHYVAQDGRLKTLNFVIINLEHLDTILSSGERVDGSSLFSHIKAGESDLYVIPKYRTAFINPFNEIPTLGFMCSFFNKEGKPLESSPEYILQKSARKLKEDTGYDFEVMGELEYYIISDEDNLYPAVDQKGYHESGPFNKTGDFRKEAMQLIASCGGMIKYGHSEVGNFVQGGKNYEQNEIEFLPCPVEDAANQLIIAKWILRKLAYTYGVTITFSPKITVGKAGSGMHIHTRLMKDGKNALVTNGELNETAHKLIGGYLHFAASLTAFGNTNPTSYFRLVPHQEAPTTICWGDRNRSALVRVPLGWSGKSNMAAIVNPLEDGKETDFSGKQTVEFRAPDGSAFVYLLIAALTVAANYGLQNEGTLKIAKENYVDINIFDIENKDRIKNLEVLPDSCCKSAVKLEEMKEEYLRDGVFTEDIIDQIILNLKSFNDYELREQVKSDPNLMENLVLKHFYCG
jgi:glutamine synthetase